MKSTMHTLSIAGATLAAAATLSAADFHDWAPTPPMGWNSFDCFGLSLTEAQAKEQAEAMIKQLTYAHLSQGRKPGIRSEREARCNENQD